MPRVEFEPTIPTSKRAKTLHALDHSATVPGNCWDSSLKLDHYRFLPYPFIIIIVGKSALSELWPYLEDSARLHPVSTLDYETVFFLQSKGVSLVCNPQPGALGHCVYIPQ
jgi:hypothetical protein